MYATSGFHIELVPDRFAPALRIRFPRGARLPRSFSPLKYRSATKDALLLPPKNGSYLEWVRSLPQRKFELQTGTWLITNPGQEYRRVFADLGFPIDELPADLLDEYDQPLVEIEPEYEYLTYVYPRFSGWHELAESLPELLIWGDSSLRVYTPDFHFHPPGAGIQIPQEILDVARTLALKPLPGCQETLDSFDGAQAQAISAIMSGHTFLADSSGNGRRIRALNAQLARGARRLIVVCRREQVERWMVAVAVGDREGLAPEDTVNFQTRTFNKYVSYLESREGYSSLVDGNSKVLNLAQDPVERIPESAVAAIIDVGTMMEFPLTALALRAWQADGMIIDNAEEFSIWENAKTAQVRWLANTVDGLRIPIADATKFSDPLEFLGLLSISGHLDPVFGGLTTYTTTVANNNRRGWITRGDKMQWLVESLNKHVWVRREDAGEVFGEQPA